MAKAGSEGKDIGRNKERAANASSRVAACVHRIGSGKMVVKYSPRSSKPGEKEC
jgi:hypothetical protein